MQVIYHLPREFYQLVKRKVKELSLEGKGRLKTLVAWEALREAGWKVERACKRLGMSRATLYRWRKRWKEKGNRGLDEYSRRPKRLRTVSWSIELIEAVRELREQYPRWGKDKLCVLLGREGLQLSASTVGRILTHLKKRGLIHDPAPYVQIEHKTRPKAPICPAQVQELCHSGSW
jgi:transposase